MQSGDQLFGYAIIILAAAPMASQLAMAQIKWTLFFPIFAIPAMTLLISLGHLSRTGPVGTFRRLAPIGAGIGWALTWQAAEKLYSENLRAAQIFNYIFFSLRTRLDWALDCDHGYNSEYCSGLLDMNITTLDTTHHYPDNFWAAQEFNRFLVRGNPVPTQMPKTWEPNMWYLGESSAEFYFTLPSLGLILGHIVTWSSIYFVLVRFTDRLGEILVKVFILLPLMLYIGVMMGMTSVSGLHFTTASIQKQLDDKKINEDPYDFWADLRGGFRTSITIVDYSVVFTGFVIFATSRLRSGVGHLSALLAVPAMMVIPSILTILRAGCEGHVSDIQPNYKIYASTDETISLDLLPVCFATSTLGPIWAVLYYLATYFFTCLGPMLVYTLFIYQSFVDDFPTVQNSPKQFIGLLCLGFSVPAIFLYMPLGTKVAALFRYTSQSSIVQIAGFILIIFVYGWQRLETDVQMTNPTQVSTSFLSYLIRPISPLWTTALFTIVPMMLCAKFVAVFDFLASGNDVGKHIEAGTQFLPVPKIFGQTIGYLIMFAPFLIMIAGGIYKVFEIVKKHGLPFFDAFRPTADWMSHASVNMTKPRPHSLAYGLFNTLFLMRYSSALLLVFAFETLVGVGLIVLLIINTFGLIGSNSPTISNDYRGIMLILFTIAHVYAMVEMRICAEKEDSPHRLTIYIAVATMETAMLNAYLWLFAGDHSWGLDAPPMLMLLANCWIRGVLILVVIAIRANIIELQRPSRARDASEIYDAADAHQIADADDDSPVIFDLARS